MVLVWGYLARGNDGHTLVMVAINSLTMLILYGLLGGFLAVDLPKKLADSGTQTYVLSHSADDGKENIGSICEVFD